MRACAVVAAILLVSCGEETVPAGNTEASPSDVARRADVERVLDDAIRSLAQLSDSIDDILMPVPLLTPAQENVMRRFGNAAQLERARALGARPADSTQLAALRADGRLVELEDSTPLWAVRRLEHSAPYVTPDAHALLTRIAERFQQRLAAIGLPPYRVEVTSVLRTPQSQADLRRTNPNAAMGTSTHEYGTTLDIAYSSFAAPHETTPTFDTAELPWLAPRLDVFARAGLEAAAARKSRELQAILGEVLINLQQAGDVMVTLERQQPVYHLTVARRLAAQ